MLGRTADNWGEAPRVGRTYYSDWGNRLVVKEVRGGEELTLRVARKSAPHPRLPACAARLRSPFRVKDPG